MPRIGWRWCSIKPGPILPVPSGLDLVFLPPDSPAVAPAARLWPLLDDVVAHQTVPTRDAFEAVLVSRCQAVTNHRPHLTSLTRYHW